MVTEGREGSIDRICLSDAEAAVLLGDTMTGFRGSAATGGEPGLGGWNKLVARRRDRSVVILRGRSQQRTRGCLRSQACLWAV